MAAMAQVSRPEEPPIGLLYRKDRPTLGESMDEIIRKAGGKVPPRKERRLAS